MRLKWAVLICFFALIIGIFTSSADAGQYRVVDLGSSQTDTERTTITAVNDAGVAVGYDFVFATATYNSIIIENGQKTVLGTLGGNSAKAAGISDNKVVGWSNTLTDKYPTIPGFAYVSKPCVWQNGAIIELETANTISDGAAYAINNSGMIAGMDGSAGIIWSNGQRTVIDSSLNYVRPNAVNEAGQVVGYYWAAGSHTDGNMRAFLWQNGLITDLGTLGGQGAIAYGINNAGQIVGWSSFTMTPGHGGRAFLWENGVMTDLGSWGGSSQAVGITDDGTIFGNDHTYGPSKGFVWKDGIMNDINTLLAPEDQVGIASVEAVSPSGNVVISSQTGHKYLLTIVPDPLLPNPMTWATVPRAVSPTSITMKATTATSGENPPFFYSFDFVDSPTGGKGGTDSAWQGPVAYTDTRLQPNHQYGYRVKLSDSAIPFNETDYSSTMYAYTFANTPKIISFIHARRSCILVVWTAHGNPNGTEYFCENMKSGANSGWVTNLYWNSCESAPFRQNHFRVKARNGDGIETGWGSFVGNPKRMIVKP